MRSILALARKDLKLLLRDKPGFFFTFFFPVLYAGFFGMIMGGMGDSPSIDVCVVDEDQSSGSKAFIEKLVAGPEIKVIAVDRDSALQRVRRGRVPAYMIVPPGFGKAYDRPFIEGMPEVEIGMDPSRKAEQGLLQGVLAKVIFERVADVYLNPENARKLIAEATQEIRDDPEMPAVARAALLTFLPALDNFLGEIPKAGGEQFLNVSSFGVKQVDVARDDKRAKNFYEISFPQGIVWALLACAASFGISLVTERTKGTLVRMRMMPIGPTDILAGKALACLITTAGVTMTLLLVARVIFGIRLASPLLLAMAIAGTCVCFVGLMMFLSVLGKTEQSAAGIGWAILMVMAMTGGGMIPLAFMPGFMRTISHFSPVKWTVYALEGAIWRGFTFWEMLLPCGILVGIGVVFFVIGVRLFQWGEQG